ncbi:single-stranded DNA-binding protein [Prevotella nigrescens ATCC 33563]|nr:single-stranded DNA-binding protein [Prevotella nigrescens ATCC 33563]
MDFYIDTKPEVQAQNKTTINIVKEEFDIKQAYTKQTKNIIETFNK